MNLYWLPVLHDGEGLSDQLKFVLRKSSGGCVDFKMDSSNLAYLRGLLDAGVDDAQKLIDAIEKHDEIRVYEE